MNELYLGIDRIIDERDKLRADLARMTEERDAYRNCASQLNDRYENLFKIVGDYEGATHYQSLVDLYGEDNG